MKFAVNHITVPHLSWLELLNFARDIGASGVEFRNDLSTPLFSGEIPEKVAEAVQNAGLQLFGLSQVYPFNSYTNQVEKKVCDLIDIAKRSGAQTISLIPNNDGKIETINEREAKLKFALNEIKPILEEAKMVALLEPLGFETSSMRTKEQAIDAIDYVGGSSVFKLVHDTFHHHLAQEKEIFPKHTKIVHISGVRLVHKDNRLFTFVLFHKARQTNIFAHLSLWTDEMMVNARMQGIVFGLDMNVIITHTLFHQRLGCGTKSCRGHNQLDLGLRARKNFA